MDAGSLLLWAVGWETGAARGELRTTGLAVQLLGQGEGAGQGQHVMCEAGTTISASSCGPPTIVI